MNGGKERDELTLIEIEDRRSKIELALMNEQRERDCLDERGGEREREGDRTVGKKIKKMECF